MNKVIFALLLCTLLPPMAGMASSEKDGHSDHIHETESAEQSNTDNHAEHSEDDAHENHEEGSTTITPEAANLAGIEVYTSGATTIHERITLTGRIVLNRDTTADITARFPGIVRSVAVKLGQLVHKGQLLARIESSDSLQVYSVVAPQQGVILNRNISQGGVAGDAPIFTIANLSTVWAEFHIFPNDLSRVAEIQFIQVQALQGDKNSDATITMLLPVADALSQTVIAVVELPNANDQWRPGMAVEGEVTVKKTPVKIAVPVSALQRTEEGLVVYVREGDSTYEAHPVTTGMQDGKMVQITQGLAGGEQVVTTNSFLIKADIGKSGAAHEH